MKIIKPIIKGCYVNNVVDGVCTFRLVNNKIIYCTIINDMHHNTIYADAEFLNLMNLTIDQLRQMSSGSLWGKDEMQRTKWRLSSEAILEGKLQESLLWGIYNAKSVKFSWKCKRTAICNNRQEVIGVISHIQVGCLSQPSDVDFSGLQVSEGAKALGISKVEFKLLYIKVFYKLRAGDIAELLGVGLNTVYMYTTALRDKLYLSGFGNSGDLKHLENLGFFKYI